MSLLINPIFALFIIISLGYFIGRLKWKGVSFDVSAVIFVALLFGHLGVELPVAIERIGMVLFIFTVGIQAGPGFLDSFRQHGRSLVLMSLSIVGTGVLLSVALMYLFEISTPIAIGLMCGALTSTPGLTVAVEATGSPLASIAYSIAYPFGVIGVILFVRLLPKIVGIDPEVEEQKLESEEKAYHPAIENRTFRVTQSPVVGKTLKEIMEKYLPGVSISRVGHAGVGRTPTREMVLEEGDLVKAVATSEALDLVELLLGPSVNDEIKLQHTYTVEQVMLTNKKFVNKQLGELHLFHNFNAVVTRVRRSGIDISPTPDLQLRFGDKLMVACHTQTLNALSKMLGNDERELSDTDFLPIALGISLGFLLGQVHITLPGDFSLGFGVTGGILIMAIILSAIGKTGPIVWTMSGSANQMLRELGLLLFLSGVGTTAGKHIVETISTAGPMMLAFGFAITLLPMIVAYTLNRFVFRLNIFEFLGVITGGMTSTPGLAACNSLTKSNVPGRAYAAVYPVAMVVLIVLVQLMSYITL